MQGEEEELFEKMAIALPDVEFSGECNYTNYNDIDQCFRKKYEGGILLEIPKNKKAKLFS